MGTGKVPFTEVCMYERMYSVPQKLLSSQELILCAFGCATTFVEYFTLVLLLCLCRAHQALTTVAAVSESATEINVSHKTVSHYQDISILI